MVPVKTILIIVNAGAARVLCPSTTRENAPVRGKISSKKRQTCGKCSKRSVNQFHDWLAALLQDCPSGRIRTLNMSLFPERIHWMPSPPLAPFDDGAIDLAHLQRMTMGDEQLEHEVLAMFAAQSASLLADLASLPPDAAALAHTLKGSARAIGAFQVAEAAEAFEATLRTDRDPANALTALNEAFAEARAAIDSMLRRC
jgi:HPt (histidine-containing phosphotransfer) domain-containing protein